MRFKRIKVWEKTNKMFAKRTDKMLRYIHVECWEKTDKIPWNKNVEIGENNSIKQA